MKILIDVNLSPSWVDVFEQHSIESEHWTSVGNRRATDTEIIEWARDNGYVVFTHDLNFTRFWRPQMRRGRVSCKCEGKM